MKKYLISIYILSFVTFSCNSHPENRSKSNLINSDSQDSSIATFWKWFQGNEEKLKYFSNDPEKILQSAYNEVEKIDSSLSMEFSEPDKNIINVTFRSNGDTSLFPVIKNIVDNAPKIEGWNFIALRQRIPYEHLKGMIPAALKGFDVDISKLYFYPIVTGDTLDIAIFYEDLTESNFNNVQHVAEKFISNILGEYDFYKKVHSYMIEEMPNTTNERKLLYPIEKIAVYVDDFDNSLNH